MAACADGNLKNLVEEYIAECRFGKKTAYADAEADENPALEKKRQSVLPRFPNIAGFCRFCGVGQTQIDILRRKFPLEYDALCAIFEDEALNSGLSVSLLSSYMKYRLGYGGDERSCDGEKNGKNETKIVFEHDIFEDGE